MTGVNKCCSCITLTIAKKTQSKAVKGKASLKASPK